MYLKKIILSILILSLGINVYSQDLGMFEKLNTLLNPYIFSYQQQEVSQQRVISPYFQLNTSNYNYGASIGTTLNFNTMYFNSIEKTLLTEQVDYSNLQNFLFSYEKINGDFFSLLAIVAENQFLETHNNLEFDVNARLYSNKLYEEMLKNVIYGYSGIKITDDILTEYINLINEIDFSNYSVSDIYQIGIIKASELNLSNTTASYNNKNKMLYGYLPELNVSFSVNDGYSQDSTINIQSDIRISIQNIGLSGNISYSFFGEEESWSSSIYLTLPINKMYTYEYQQNEYSFSSESFLINLSGMLYSYNKLKDRTDTEGQYELLMLKVRLLPAIKKYMELY